MRNTSPNRKGSESVKLDIQMYSWYTEKLENGKQKGKNLRLSGL